MPRLEERVAVERGVEGRATAGNWPISLRARQAGQYREGEKRSGSRGLATASVRLARGQEIARSRGVPGGIRRA